MGLIPPGSPSDARLWSSATLQSYSHTHSPSWKSCIVWVYEYVYSEYHTIITHYYTHIRTYSPIVDHTYLQNTHTHTHTHTHTYILTHRRSPADCGTSPSNPSPVCRYGFNTYVYMCICVYVYMCICVYVYMGIWVYVYMCICVYVS
jgi:hypothetical protein